MVLIFIVTLSLIAAVGMRSVITGDRVVANERDRALAFQAAESAGREGVAAIKAAIIPGGSFPTKTYPTPHPLGGNAQFWRTTSTLPTNGTDCTASSDTSKRFDWLNCSTASATAYGNKVNPRYVIEKMGGVTTTVGKAVCWYRVTSHATGGSSEADVILQLMFPTPEFTGLPSACP